MPGIVGFITKGENHEECEAKLHRMLHVLRHKPSYVTGTWVDRNLGVYAGWTARKGSFEDGMPLRDESGNHILIFSGEEFPAPDLRPRLKQQGHAIGDLDASYLVHVAEMESDFPRSLNGRFHGLLVNRADGLATLFNDRFSMHRLYIHEGQDAFYFAAEAKAILAICPEVREADLRGMGEFVSCGCVLQNRTLFKGIEILPAGSAWKFVKGVLEEKKKYFDESEWEGQGPLPSEEYYPKLKEVFSRNLPRYFNGRERIAMSLTGGLDTRMILAWAKPPAGSLPGYTFSGPVRECHDVTIARKVAEATRQSHQVIPLGEEFFSRFDHYAEQAIYLTDGTVGVNRAADLYANEIASTIAPVRMTGNYGSEILRHLRAFRPTHPIGSLYQPEVMEVVKEADSTYKGLLSSHAVTFTAFRQAPWYQYGLLSLEQTQLAVRSPFLDNDLVQLAFRAPNAQGVKSNLFEDSDDCGRLIKDGNADLHRIPTDRGLGGAGGWTSPISRAILEFSFKAEYAYDYGMPQWLARVDGSLKWMHLERLFLGRHKFCHFRVWYRDRLSRYVREVLMDSRSLARPYIHRAALEYVVTSHLEGKKNFTTELSRLLTLELQHRLFLDS